MLFCLNSSLNVNMAIDGGEIMNEVWKPVEGYEGFYEVSNTGKVRSVDRVVLLAGKSAGQTRKYTGKELKPLISQGHATVHLQSGQCRRTISVGRLVALHFLDGFKESGRFYVNYKDGNVLNCSIDNLE